MEGIKVFTKKQKSNPVNWQSNYEFGPRPIM